jgi:hypothetical protein
MACLVERNKAYRNSTGKLHKASLSEGLRSRREDNIKAADRRETAYEGMNWIHFNHYNAHF